MIPNQYYPAMKKIIFISFLICSVLTAYGQELIKETPSEINIPKDDVRQLQEGLEPPEPKRPELHYDNPYYRDRLDNPIRTGFENMVMQSLYNDFSLSIIGRSEVWPGITTINSAIFDLSYEIDLFSFNAGTTFWKMDGTRQPFNDISFYANAAFNPTPWLTIGAYGQYSVMSKDNFRKHRFVLPPEMIPYTSYGISSKVMFNSNFGIEGSLGRQFNPMKNRWEPTYSIGPSIDFTRKKKKK